VASAVEFSSIPVTRRHYPDNEQRIATRSLRRKMARSQALMAKTIIGMELTEGVSDKSSEPGKMLRRPESRRSSSFKP
jgi:hypothetical protein